MQRVLLMRRRPMALVRQVSTAHERSFRRGYGSPTNDSRHSGTNLTEREREFATAFNRSAVNGTILTEREREFAAAFNRWSDRAGVDLPAWTEFIRVWRSTSLYFIERNAPELRLPEASRDKMHASLAESYHLFGDISFDGGISSTPPPSGSKILSEGQARDIFCLSSRDLEPLHAVSVLRPDPRVSAPVEADKSTLARCYPLPFVRVQALKRWGSRAAFDAERAHRAAVHARRVRRVHQRHAELIATAPWYFPSLLVPEPRLIPGTL